MRDILDFLGGKKKLKLFICFILTMIVDIFITHSSHQEVLGMELNSLHSLAYLFSDHGFLNFSECENHPDSFSGIGSLAYGSGKWNIAIYVLN